MKKILFLTALAALMFALLVSCGEIVGTTNPDTTSSAPESSTSAHPDTELPSGMITVEQAIGVAGGLDSAFGTSTATYLITGYVTAIGEEGVTLTENGHSILCVLGGKTYDELRMGYLVSLSGKVQNRNGTPAFVNFTVENMSAATYIVSTLLSDHGSIALSKAQGIAWGESVTVTVTANAGYTVTAIKVNGETVTNEASVTLTVKENLSIEAVFAPADGEDTDNGGNDTNTDNGGNDNSQNGGAEAPAEKTTVAYTFADYPIGSQYAKETHKLDDVLTVETDGCYFIDQLRIYQDSNYNGIAVLKAAAPITAITVNAGHKSSLLDVFGSADGVTYELIGSIEVTTAYTDRTLTFTKGYRYVKLDAVSAQVRIQTLTVTYN